MKTANIARLLEPLVSVGLSGPWWHDGRERHCAYCGIMMRKTGVAPTSATRDHVIPLAHGGANLTIPACRECNAAKADKSLPEHIAGPHFAEKRAKKHGKAWPVHELLAAHAVAALKLTYALMLKAANPPVSPCVTAPSPPPKSRKA